MATDPSSPDRERPPAAYADVDVTIRPATHDDYEGIVAFTSDTWADRGGSDYIPDVYHDWIDKPDAATLLADAGDRIAGIAQIVALSGDEAWAQGMRVNPVDRGAGVSVAINTALFDWARERGATVARNMVFSWNVAGLGASWAAGFRPCTEFRWIHPDPDPAATGATGHETVNDPTVAWRAWADGDARGSLAGLGLALRESWSMLELTPDLLAEAAAGDDGADGTSVVAARRSGGAVGCAYRTRTFERTDDETGETRVHAEYGVGAWRDLAAGRELLAGIAQDAASVGADRTRVLVPEDPRYVMEASTLRVEIGEEPDFVNAADLTGDYPDYRSASATHR
jgi:GNAT superfamily N-acetyltransferase